MRKIVKSVALSLLFLTLSFLLAFMVYLHFWASEYKDISGQWTAQADMTKQAAVTAFIWLQDIEGVDISREDVEARMGDLTVQVNMTLEKTGRSAGTFRSCIVPESYEACNQAAYEAFAVLFCELTGERLRMAGYTGDTGEEAVEALAEETFGMSAVSYLMSCGPALLPSLEEMQREYDGSGSYVTAEGILTRQFEADGAASVKAERYIREGKELVLTGETGAEHSDDYPVVYTLQEAETSPVIRFAE